jgi:hypothetical protein
LTRAAHAEELRIAAFGVRRWRWRVVAASLGILPEFKIRLFPWKREELDRRARSHGMRRPSTCGRWWHQVRRRAAACADDWWDGLPGDRRAQVHRWLTQRGHTPEGPMPGQLEMHP